MLLHISQSLLGVFIQRYHASFSLIFLAIRLYGFTDTSSLLLCTPMRVFNTEGNLLHAIRVRVVASSRHQDFIPRIWRRAAQVPSDKATFSNVIRFRAPWPQQCETRIMTRQRCSAYGYRMNRVKESVRFFFERTHTHARRMRSFYFASFLVKLRDEKGNCWFV